MSLVASGSDSRGIFNGLTFWIDEALPHAPQLARQIKNNGGEVIGEAATAEFYLLHPETRGYAKTHVKLQHCQGLIISPHWVEDCVTFQKRLPTQGQMYSLPIPDPPMSDKARRTITLKRDLNLGRGGPRNKYTDTDDERLARAVAKYSGRKERDALCKRLGKKYPQHTWSSYKEHWRKVKKDWIDHRAADILAANPGIIHEDTSSDSPPEIIREEDGYAELDRPVGYVSRKRKLAPIGDGEANTPEDDGTLLTASRTEASDIGSGLDAFGSIEVPSLNGDHPTIDPHLSSAGQSYDPIPLHTSSAVPSWTPTAKQLEHQRRQNYADIVWAANGDEAVAAHFMRASLEEQADLLDSLWQPEQDILLVSATPGDDGPLASVARARRCSMADVRERQTYLVANRRKTRLPIGANRWPFATE